MVRKVSTKCHDRAAAESILADLARRAEMVKGGILTASEDRMIDHQDILLADHVAAYLLKLEAEGTSPMHRDNVRRALNRLAADCQFKWLGNLAREDLERWLVSHDKAGMGARTRNTYRAAAVAFCNWCIETGRLLTNPFAAVAKADEAADPRRQRRALTETELTALLDVARRRPLVDAMTIPRWDERGRTVDVHALRTWFGTLLSKGGVASQAEVTTAMDIVVSVVIVVGLAMIVLMLIGRPPPPTRRFSKYTREPDEEFKREFERDRAFLAAFIKKQEIERELETGLRPKQFGLAGLLLLVTAVAIVLSIWKWVSFR
ncbi:MAG: hypothetical protein NTW96_05610 [Planctomycetia bacterium]|nr:hypothetical protein [Planctomycetia bacterium]